MFKPDLQGRFRQSERYLNQTFTKNVACQNHSSYPDICFSSKRASLNLTLTRAYHQLLL